MQNTWDKWESGNLLEAAEGGIVSVRYINVTSRI